MASRLGECMANSEPAPLQVEEPCPSRSERRRKPRHAAPVGEFVANWRFILSPVSVELPTGRRRKRASPDWQLGGTTSTGLGAPG